VKQYSIRKVPNTKPSGIANTREGSNKMFKVRDNPNGTQTLIEENLSTGEEKEWQTYQVKGGEV